MEDQISTQPEDNTQVEPSTFFKVLSIEVPKTTEWIPERDVAFISMLFTLPAPLSLAIVATHDRIGWRIIANNSVAHTISANIYSSHKLADIDVKSMNGVPIGYYHFPMHFAAPFVAPLMYANDFKKVDPLAGLLGAMTYLEEGDAIIYQITLNEPPTKKQLELGEKAITTSSVNWWDLLIPYSTPFAATNYAYKGSSYDKFVPEIQRALQQKLSSNMMQVTFSFKVKAASRDHADHLVRALFPTLASYEREAHNFFVQAQEKSYSLILNASEVAALWHLPNEKCDLPGVVWAPGVSSPLPTAIKEPETGVKLGVNRYQQKTNDVWLDDKDRITHVNIIGKTGTGKSTLMHHLIHQDIAAGKGVGVIDPHGVLVDNILATSIPSEREKDVILLEISDEEYCIGLNLLTGPEDLTKGTIAGQALAIIRKMFADDWNPGRMEDALHSALVAAMDIEDSTIQTIPKLLYNSSFRAEALRSVEDPIALEFWYDEFEPTSAAYQREFARPITHRLRKFYRNEVIRSIVCQPDCLDFRAILDEGKIFLAKIGGISDIDAETMGSLLVSKIQMAAMSRGAVSADNIAEYFLYIDEVQNFITTSLPEMFSGARKFGLRLVVANQFLRQLEGKTLDAVMGTVGTSIMFSLGPNDANQMAPYVKPVHTNDDLINLDRFHTVVKMQAGGKTLPAFSMKTQEPINGNRRSTERIEQIRNLSRQKNARPRKEVEAEMLAKFHSDRDRFAADKSAEESYFG